MVLEDETLQLGSAGLKNHSILYLELGARPPSDSLLLTVILVSGNSTEVKYTSDEAGQRLQEVEITAHANDTVESLRDRAGVLLLGYAEGWTRRSALLMQGSGVRNHLGEELVLPVPPAMDADLTEGDASQTSASNLINSTASCSASVSIGQDAADGALTAVECAPVVEDPRALVRAEFGDSFLGRRLRRTSWLKEFTDLAMETAEDSAGQKASTAADSSKQLAKAAQSRGGGSGVAVAPSTDVMAAPVLLTLKDAGFKSGDTLLLEEGTLPVRGQMTIPVCCAVFNFQYFLFSGVLC